VDEFCWSILPQKYEKVQSIIQRKQRTNKYLQGMADNYLYITMS
jgi:hypothetical protein